MRTGLVRVTVTPGARAPVLSVTLPVTVPVWSDWAKAVPAKAGARASTTAPHVFDSFRFIDWPPRSLNRCGTFPSREGRSRRPVVGSLHRDRTDTSPDEGFHHALAAAVEMGFHGRLRDRGVPPF